MECESVDSKKLYKVFDASKRKRARKKREGQDDSNSVATDDTASGCQANCRSASAKTSLQHVPTVQTISMNKDSHKRDRDRDRDSSPAVSPSPTEAHHKRSSTDTRRSDMRASRSPRRNRRRDDMSLALKAGLISPSTSISPRQGGLDSLVPDQDSIIYAYLEDALKKEKKKERQSRRHDDYRSCQRHQSATHRHRHHHHHRRRCEEVNSRDRDKSKDLSTVPLLNQAILFETFAKLCAQFNEKSAAPYPNQVKRSLSHKSLQCEVLSKHNYQDVDQRPTRLPNRTEEQSRDNVSRIRSQENFHGRSQERVPMNSRPDTIEKQEKCGYPPYEKDPRYVSKLDLTSSRMRTVDDRTYQEYSQNHIPEGTCHDQYRTRPPQEYRDYREYEKDRRNYEDKRYLDQRTSRSFDVRDHRDGYPDDEKWRRTARSDNVKEKRYDPRDRRYDERYKYYYEDKVDRERYNMPQRDSRRSRRNLERFERNSIASREDDYKDRDRYSEKERDSGLSVADGENSTVSGKSNYLRTMKQEIAEQREAMDKMMKLWKELMRCFKGMTPQTQGQDRAVHENAANVRDSAAAQLRLWRECMRRYETVARDVGDTDARLMEEINKQRSEMAEMATMWQECLQRYREMSTDFNSLKQQLTPPEPVRLPAAPVACAEGEGHVPPAAPYRLPPTYPPQMPPVSGYGSPLRHNASAPPAWWWNDARPSPRRRSSPDSRGSRDRDRERRHRQKNRDDTRYKDKPSKPSAARSEHRHRKR